MFKNLYLMTELWAIYRICGKYFEEELIYFLSIRMANGRAPSSFQNLHFPKKEVTVMKY